MFLSFVLLCLLLIGTAAYKISETPFFCSLCHNMKVYVDSWKASSHKNVTCIECHYKPGLINHLKGKWKDGQLSLVYFVTGKKVTKPHAEIDDLSCLQSGCHKRGDLKKEVVFKNVVFNHLHHLEEMKRQKKLRCTTCHSQIVQGAHITVTDVECFICHFYKTRDQKGYITGCTSCHYEPKGDIEINKFTFNHKRYIKRGIKCETCHTSVISGDGHIPEYACMQCHNKREIIEAKYTPEALHRNHVTDHKVECFTCHSAIKHEIGKKHPEGMKTAECGQCHSGKIHNSMLAMYQGKGAKLTEDIPNRMAVLNMDCNVCHKHDKSRAALVDRCKDCHGSLTDGMVERWRKNSKAAQEDILKLINELKGVAQKTDIGFSAKKKLDDAVFNYRFLAQGVPVHNIVYATEVARKTKETLSEVKARMEGKPFKAGKSGLTCTDMCHGDLGEKKIPFGKVAFQHMIHAEDETTCLKCHSPYSNHGNTMYQGCSECHHGKGSGKVGCVDCHRAQGAMVKAKGSLHSKVACIKCHGAVAAGKKEGVGEIKSSCRQCHDKEYTAMADEWVEQGKKIEETLKKAKGELEKEIAAVEAKEGRHSVPLRKVFDEAYDDMNGLIRGGYAHNPAYGDRIIEKSKKNVEILRAMIKDKKEGKVLFVR